MLKIRSLFNQAVELAIAEEHVIMCKKCAFIQIKNVKNQKPFLPEGFLC